MYKVAFRTELSDENILRISCRHFQCRILCPSGTSFASSVGDKCTTDFVVIPGGQYKSDVNNNVAAMADRYCALGFPNIVTSEL